jgi:hypothetical protein
MAAVEQIYQKIVLFQFPEPLSKDDEVEFFDQLNSFPLQIPGIMSLTCGKDTSGRSKGYSHALIIRFESEKAYDEYHPHPVHQAFADFVYQRNCNVLSCNFPVSEQNDWEGA